MNKITVMIAEDQQLFREGLRTILALRESLEIVGEAANGQEAIEAARRFRPSVVLMDLQMPVLDGVAATRVITEQLPETRVIVLTTFDDDDLVFEGLRAGAVGYLLKDTPSEKLFEAIELAARGESFLQPSIASKIVAEFARLTRRETAKKDFLVEELSKRETEVLALMSEGLSNKEIGERLFISEGTVKNHVTNILGKLGVRDRTQAVLLARKYGLV